MLIGSYYYEVPTEFPSLIVTSIYFVLFCIGISILSRPFKSILRPYVLLLANCVFLWSFSKDFSLLILIIICSIISYICGLIISKTKNKIVLYVGICFFVLLLAYYKIGGFISANSIAIPLGLSFYSFKIISYLIDVYRDNTKLEKNIIYYLDYVMFFPCITAGPINRSEPFLKEIKRPSDFDYKDAKSGGFQLVLGIFEKIVFCDFVAQVVFKTLDVNTVTDLNVLIGIFLYSIQIYLDFDAASNIAVGSARLLGFHLPKNFNSPYLSRNLKEFWSNWHISLSTWFKDYVYIPLGGNKRGEKRKYINILIVFVLSGIWHGSTFNFLLWGILHGLLRVVEDYIESKFKFINTNNIFINIIRIIINFVLVSFLWLPFRYQHISDVFSILSRLFINCPLDFNVIGLTINEMYWLLVVIVLVVLLDILRKFKDMLYIFNRLFFPFRWIVYALMIVTFLIFGVYGGSFEATDFIYRFF